MLFQREVNNILSFSNLTKAYPDGTIAVKDFSLEIKRGEFVVLIGPSGCGKSTTLRMINRLIEPSSGTVVIDGQDYKNYHPVELRRRLGYVIQQTGLIPHLTIAENISFVLKLKGVKETERRARAKEMLKLVGMNPEVFLDRFPGELSGGQQQRIGVLRALAHDPDIILMDEPFGALDPITREQLQDELKRLQRNVHKTIVFVTHDMDEAIRMADRIVIMRDGHIVQAASPEQILRAPADEFVANFIGRQRLIRQVSEVRVGEVMAKSVVTVPAQSGLTQALELMMQKSLEAIVVVDQNGKFKGFVTLEEVKKELAQRDASQVGTFSKLHDVSVRPETSVFNSIRLMLAHKLDMIPVIEIDGTVVGVVTRGDLVGLLNDIAGVTLATLPTDDLGMNEGHASGKEVV